MAEASFNTQRRRAGLALLLLVPVPSMGVYFAMMFEPTRGTPAGQLIYAASKVWILALPVIWLVLVEKGRPGFSPLRHGGLWIGALTGLGIAIAIGTAYVLVGDRLIDLQQMRHAAQGNGIGTPARYLALAAYLALINALLEEYVWRWFVYRHCERLLGRTMGVAVAALLFTVHHILALRAQTSWEVTLMASTGIFIGACVWSWLYGRFRSIWPGYVSHVLADVAVFAVGWWVLFEGQG